MEKNNPKKILIMCTSDRLGKGDDALGEKLLGNFLRTLQEMGDALWKFVFVNSGVMLTTEASALLDDLKTLESAGAQVLVCGTCLAHFNLRDKKRVGETTNMVDIVSPMQLADKVITV